MHVVLPLMALLLATGAGAPQTIQVEPAPAPAPGPSMGPVIGMDESSPLCRDRIHEVRRELGQPALERDAAPEDPLFIAAIHKTIGGCAVLVMRDDTSDIRPLPEPRAHRLMPAK